MVVYPDEWDHSIQNRGHFSFAYRRLGPESFSESPEPLMVRDPIRRIVIHNIDWLDRHGVQLTGCTPEEFEQIPRCGFLPGAGYLRGVIE
jgi:hypothetical protein